MHSLLRCYVLVASCILFKANINKHLEESSEEVEDQCTVCGQLRAPGLVGPAAPAVPGEGRQAGPFRKCPEPGQNVAPGGGRQQVPGLLPLQQLCQPLILVNGLNTQHAQSIMKGGREGRGGEGGKGGGGKG